MLGTEETRRFTINKICPSGSDVCTLHSKIWGKVGLDPSDRTVYTPGYRALNERTDRNII